MFWILQVPVDTLEQAPCSIRPVKDEETRKRERWTKWNWRNQETIKHLNTTITLGLNLRVEPSNSLRSFWAFSIHPGQSSSCSSKGWLESRLWHLWYQLISPMSKPSIICAHVSRADSVASEFLIARTNLSLWVASRLLRVMRWQ